jgi:hypothetical protein
MFNWKTRECVQSREVLICMRVDETDTPPTPSFNCQCELCDARIWVSFNSPIEPARVCATCSAAHNAHVSQPPLHQLHAS